jgi:geranylgeranyl transferase type-1 subunit beta
MLGQDAAQILNSVAIRRFLFEQTQHMIGGFGKTPGAPPGMSLLPSSSLIET